MILQKNQQTTKKREKKSKSSVLTNGKFAHVVVNINPYPVNIFSVPYIQIRKFYERKIVIIFLPINLNMCFGCSKEPSH